MTYRPMLRSALVLMVLFGAALVGAAQFKIDLVTCEDLKITPTSSSTVEHAACVTPTKAFKPKGTLRNVHILSTFPAVPTGAGVTFLITKDNADGEHVQYVDYAVSPKHTSAHAQLTINQPGKYFVRMVNYYDKKQVWATVEFTVGEDTVGPRAAGNQAAGQGMVAICKTVDDNWNCVGGSNEWSANQGFDILFKNPVPVGVDFIGIVIYKQGSDGKDVDQVKELQQQIGEKNRFYATVNNEIRLPAGTYSVYIIAWGKRELMMKNGNLKEYFAKTTLTVK